MTQTPIAQRYVAEFDAENRGWYEITDLIRRLTPDECLEPGYYRNPDWTVRDVVAHVGTWLAEAELQLEQISVGTYEGHDVDIDGLNETFLAAMRERMLQAWQDIDDPDGEAVWWIRKSGGDHYAEHIKRLRAWVDELVGRREKPQGG